jgi:hypothetical protein
MKGLPGRRVLGQYIHDLLCGGVLRTPPVALRPAAVSICSLVSSRDFVMYLAAIKSFYAQLGSGKVVAIDDGSLTPQQKRSLRDHVPGMDLLHIADAPRRKTPRGGCWERLLFMIELGRSDYVLQLDSDTLSRGPLAEVADACAAGRPFILAGDREGAEIISREAASRNRASATGNHIQTVIEQKLDGVAGLRPRYVRGCAAFFGLPPGSLSFEEVEEFSEAMQRLLGARWAEWGTEQATVNYFLANLSGTQVLQPPKYTHRWKVPPEDDSAFIHFIGSHRFEAQFYAFQTRRVIHGLRQPLLKPDLASA